MQLGAVIFGQIVDPHVGEVVEYLNSSGVQVRIFDIYKDNLAVSIDNGSKGGWPILDFVDQCDGVVIWSRQKRPMGAVRPEWAWGDMSGDNTLSQFQTAKFWKSEWAMFRMGLQAELAKRAHVRRINAGTTAVYSTFKPVQLGIAKAAGFDIPRTVIGNDFQIVRATFGENVLYKPLSGEGITGIGSPPPAILRTKDLLEADLADMAPGIFQERIEKKYELRVTVCGNEITAVKIDSQSMNITKLDWRKAQGVKEIHSVYRLEDSVRAKVIDYMRLAQLDFGAIDLAITPDDNCIFFECNPEGQWLWMERHLDLTITQSVARMLEASAARAAAEKGPPQMIPEGKASAAAL